MFGNKGEIEVKVKEIGVFVEGIVIYEFVIDLFFDELVVVFVECCKGKVIEEVVCKMFVDLNYFGIMFVYIGKVEGFVSGVVYFIGDIVCLVL